MPEGTSIETTGPPRSASRGSKSSAARGGGRANSSLGNLTREFCDLLRSAEGGLLDLNEAVRILDVKKRRIYDITNVLEGIGLLVKKSKNQIQWNSTATLDSDSGSGSGDHRSSRSRASRAAASSGVASSELSSLQSQLDDLEVSDAILSQHIHRVQDILRDLVERTAHDKTAYVTHADVRLLPDFEDQTVIAIKAPPGSKLEVPDPDEGMEWPSRRFNMFLSSSQGPIDVYLVSEGAPPDEPPGV